MQLGAELQLAAYEALTATCSALAATAHPFFVTAACAALTRERAQFPLLQEKAELMVDGLIKALLQNVNSSALVGALARSRRAILAAYKARVRACVFLRSNGHKWIRSHG